MTDPEAGTTPATPPQRYVCAACGKTSPTRYGFDADNRNVADAGWDESCMLNAVLCEPSDGPSPWKAVEALPAHATDPDPGRKLRECVEELQRVAKGKP